MPASKVRVKQQGTIGKSVRLQASGDATAGATIGSTLFFANGQVVTLQTLAAALAQPAALVNAPPNISGGAGAGGTPYVPPLTTKGDVFTYTTVPARIAVGSDGQLLSADSTQATGLKWIAAPSGGGGGDAPFGTFTAPPQTGWTLDNVQNTTATFDASGALLLTTTATNSSQVLYRRALAPGDFDVKMFCSVEGGSSVALVVRDSSSGNLIAFGGFGSGNQGPANSINLTSAAGATFTGWGFSSVSWGPSSGGGNTPYPQPAFWLRLTRVSGNYTLYYSMTGLYWNALGNGTNTFAATPDQFAIAVGNNPAGLIRVQSWTGV